MTLNGPAVNAVGVTVSRPKSVGPSVPSGLPTRAMHAESSRIHSSTLPHQPLMHLYSLRNNLRDTLVDKCLHLPASLAGLDHARLLKDGEGLAHRLLRHLGQLVLPADSLEPLDDVLLLLSESLGDKVDRGSGTGLGRVEAHNMGLKGGKEGRDSGVVGSACRRDGPAWPRS